MYRLYVYIYVLFAYIHTHIHAKLLMYMHEACIHIYIHTHTPTRTHIRTKRVSLLFNDHTLSFAGVRHRAAIPSEWFHICNAC
jgi:hypothetical protein